MSLCSSWIIDSTIPLPPPTKCIYGSYHRHHQWNKPSTCYKMGIYISHPGESSWQISPCKIMFWVHPARKRPWSPARCLADQRTQLTLLVETHRSPDKHKLPIHTDPLHLPVPKNPPSISLVHCSSKSRMPLTAAGANIQSLSLSMITTRDAWHFCVEAFHKWKMALQSKWIRVQKNLQLGLKLPGLEIGSWVFL